MQAIPEAFFRTKAFFPVAQKCLVGLYNRLFYFHIKLLSQPVKTHDSLQQNISGGNQ